MNDLVTVQDLRSEQESFVNAIIESQGANLPACIEEIIPVLEFSRAKAKAYQALCDASRRVSEQEELNQAALASGQRWGIVHLYGQKRLGELTREMPKAHTGASGTKSVLVSPENEPKGKQIKRSGIGWQAASDAERIAAHPEVLERVIAESERRGDIPTKTAVLHAIKREAASFNGPREQPDINKVLLDIHGKLIDCRNKLLRVFEHRDSLDDELVQSIRHITEDISGIIFDE